MTVSDYAGPNSESSPRKFHFIRSMLMSRSSGAWALADQAVASIGNFATTLLVARNLPVERYGAFGMLMEVFLFLNGVQAALVIYPLSVRGAVLDEKELRRFSTGALTLAAFLAFPLAMGMAGTALFVGGPMLALIVAFALMVGQLQETMRRTLMAHLRFADAVPGDAISYLLQALILLVLARFGLLTLKTAFIAMGATSLLAAGVQAIQIGFRAFPWHELRPLAIDCWRRGRWILFAGLATLASALSYNWTLVLSHGLGEVGRFQVMANLMKFANPVTAALSGAMLPAVARANASGEPGQMKRAIIKFAGLAAALLLPYFLLIEIFPSQCIHFLYGARPEYLELSGLVRIFMIACMFNSTVSFMFAYLNGVGESRVNFFASATNGIISLVVAMPLIVFFGLKGVIIGGFMGNAGLAVTAACFMVRHRRIERQQIALEISASVPAEDLVKPAPQASESLRAHSAGRSRVGSTTFPPVDSQAKNSAPNA